MSSGTARGQFPSGAFHPVASRYHAAMSTTPSPSTSGAPAADAATAPRQALSLFDSTCLIVGIIIGAGIYQTAPQVALGAGGPWAAIGLWALGGLLSLCGAIGYAELAAAYPREGGDYVYLGRAYGGWAGFLFAWAQLAVVRPGDIAVMALIFAGYAATLLGRGDHPAAVPVLASLAVVIFTLLNVIGVNAGKWSQNLLTVAKVLGLLAIVVVALLFPSDGAVAASRPTVEQTTPWSVALILVLFTFGGWNEMAYVAAEVRRPERNIVRALVLGTLAVTALYVTVNIAYFAALGWAGVVTSSAVAADAIGAAFPTFGVSAISILVCVSSLGAVNGLIFTGARISYALGRDHRIVAPLGVWNAATGTPVRALLAQGAIALALILALGTYANAILYTAPVVYAFYLATSAAVFVLRRRDPHTPRPYRVTGYPWTTLVFCGVCGWLIYSAAVYKPNIALAALGLLVLGLPLYALSRAVGPATRNSSV